ncbi:MAG: hypothetical protein ACLU92_13225, partial [Coprococcus comes]
LRSDTRSIAFTWIGRICMLKIRLQGTLRDIRWFRKLIEQHEEIEVLRTSEPFANKGTNKYFRVYSEIEKKER